MRLRMSGFTLVELLVGLILGLLLVVGLSAVMVQSSDSFRAVQANAAMIDDGRYASDVLANELNHVGFFGHYLPQGGSGTPPANLCAIDEPTLNAVVDGPFPLAVLNGSSTDPTGGCIADYSPNTDVIAVRRAATILTPPAGLSNASNVGRWFIQSNATGTAKLIGQALGSCEENKALFTLNGPNLFDRSAPAGYDAWSSYLGCFPGAAAGESAYSIDIRELFIDIFYIGTCMDCTNGGDGVPTLRRLRVTGAGQVDEPIARNVENLQVYLSGDQSTKVDGHTDISQLAPTDVDSHSGWNLLTGAEIFMLVRTEDEVLRGATIQARDYLLGPVSTDTNQWITTNDGFRRRVFRVHLRLNNLTHANASG